MQKVAEMTWEWRPIPATSRKIFNHFTIMANGKTAIVIAGPTAAGKTRFAIDVAKHFKTEIISADSRQCYKELKIGVARPSEKELAEVPHHFIASHSIHDHVTAASFRDLALQKASEIFSESDHVVVTGGTGLYLKAFCEGLDEIPAVSDSIREQLRDEYAKQGMKWLQETVSKEDPTYFETGETENPHRLLRALEVKRSTGRSITAFQKGNAEKRDFSILKTLLELPREKLYERINRRVDAMMEMGLLDEVKGLLPYKDLKALQTVGYAELFDYLDGKTSLPSAVEEIKKNTRHYAKRQMTWFRKQEYLPLSPAATPQEIEILINELRPGLPL
jgi:tRNA dimethylallyltransferase